MNYKKQCCYREMVEVCMNFCIPGKMWCKYHEPPISQKPIVVCLCGSTKYWETFRDIGLELTLSGIIVLSIGICSPDSITFAQNKYKKEIKIMLDELHKRKIDLADEILVLDVDGYIGKSTQSEIDYAQNHGKIIRYLSQTGIYKK